MFWLIVVFLAIYGFVATNFPNMLRNDDLKLARSILLNYTQLLTTIFAITVSLTLLGLQFLFQAYTPRLLKEFFRDKMTMLFVVTYPASIILNLFSASFSDILPPQDFVFPAFLLFSFCLVILGLYVVHMSKKVQPESILSELKNEIAEDFYEYVTSLGRFRTVSKKDEPFVVLEQVLIKSIKNNDFYSYLGGLRLLSRCIIELLVKASKKEANEEKRSHSSSIIGYFSRILQQVKNEALENRREEFLAYFCSHMVGVTEKLYEIKAHHAIGYIYDIFETVGYRAVEDRLKVLLDEYNIQLRQLVKTELDTCKAKIFPIDIAIEEHAKLSKAEKEEMIVDEILFHNLEFRRLNFLKDLSIAASENKLRDFVSGLNSIFYDIISYVLELKKPQMKRLLVYDVVSRISEAHFRCIDNEINATTFTTSMLHYLIEKLTDPKELKAFGEFLVANFCEMSYYSIKAGFYTEIYHLGANGRFLISEYPDLASIIVDTLKKSLRVLKTEEQKNLAIKELKSLERWGSHPHKKLTKKIQEILKKSKTRTIHRRTSKVGSSKKKKK